VNRRSAAVATDELNRRAAIHAALGEPARLAIVDDLSVSDRSPKELGSRLGLPSNLLAHHLDVLEGAGLVTRVASAGDARRKYVRLVHGLLVEIAAVRPEPVGGEMYFVCTRNSARSQLAAAMWSARTGRSSRSAGTQPANRVHPGAIKAARRAGLVLDDAVPRPIVLGPGTHVVTVCDQAHEALRPGNDWWHWSIPDPVANGRAAAFDAVVADLDARITTILDSELRTERATS
jgi:ArsR family transcriptional regulator, arsenate/arsenite/antimonite-responsive transcriptional repressor / arsenate reductase (thioredoxin)